VAVKLQYLTETRKGCYHSGFVHITFYSIYFITSSTTPKKKKAR